MPIPEFREDGFLPEGVHSASEAEVLFRFGAATRRRRMFAIRLRRWLELGKAVGAIRLLVDGSFVTAKMEPADVDAVIYLPPRFEQLVREDSEAALELDEDLRTRQPAELFAAEDDADWSRWVEFFTRTREEDGRRKGVVEIAL